jgi:hypothetical protein
MWKQARTAKEKLYKLVYNVIAQRVKYNFKLYLIVPTA